MKNNVVLTVTSLISIVLVTLHISDDIVRGIDKVGPASVIAMSVLVVWLCGILTLGHRRSGYIIMLLGGILGAGIAVLHMVLGVSRTLARSPDGALLFIWTLWALGVTGAFTAVLSARGLWLREWTRHANP
jgi:hypothetical protein